MTSLKKNKYVNTSATTNTSATYFEKESYTIKAKV